MVILFNCFCCVRVHTEETQQQNVTTNNNRNVVPATKQPSVKSIASVNASSTSNISPISKDIKVRTRIKDICEKSLKDLPVGKDFPRLARKFQIYRVNEMRSNSILVEDGVLDQILQNDIHFELANKFNKAAQRHSITISNERSTTSKNTNNFLQPNLDLCSTTLTEEGQEFNYYISENKSREQQTQHHHHTLSYTQDFIEFIPWSDVVFASDPSNPLQQQKVEAEDEMIAEKQQSKIVYHLTKTLHGLVNSATAIPNSQFPDETTFEKEVNLSDHVSFTNFLLNNFGDYHPLIRIMKATQQTIVINILQLIKTSLMKSTNLQFKDARGEWHLFVKFFVNAGKITLTHKRSEELFVQRSPDYVLKNKLRNANELLFPFSWIVTIEFDAFKDMQISNIQIKYLEFNQQLYSQNSSQYSSQSTNFQYENDFLRFIFEQCNNQHEINCNAYEHLDIIIQKYGPSKLTTNNTPTSGTTLQTPKSNRSKK